MTTINSSNEVLQSLSIQGKQAEEQNELGKDAFLQLMIAQLKNQDPLSPAKNEDFIAQLAQFSTVEGIQNIETSIGDLSSTFRSSQALEASALVGRMVQVPSDTATLLADRAVGGAINLPASTNNLSFTVETLEGEVIRTENMGSQARGDITFVWDGTNQSGELMAPGTYRIKANALIDGESTELGVSVGANVNSVTIGQNNTMILNVEGVGALSLDQIEGFL